MNYAYPQFAPANVQLNSLPYQDAWAKIANVYADSARANMEQLWVSSSKIIIEETTKAMMAASQSCMEALSRNAVSVQQQSFNRLLGDNQRVFEILGQSVADSMNTGWRPAR